MFYDPIRSRIALDATLTDSDGVTFTVRGVYTVSTIPARYGTETVLFRDEGTGPSQLSLWHWRGHPSAETVGQLLDAGKFDAIGVSS